MALHSESTPAPPCRTGDAEPQLNRTASAALAAGRRMSLWVFLLAGVAAIVYLMATASTGPADPLAKSTIEQGRTTVVFNSAIIVFREGLEAVLIFAAVTASFLGANAKRKRPVIAGALGAFGVSILTWFGFGLILDVASPLGPKLEAITGFIAIVVLLIVLNWFVHKVYWSQWIARHHRQRRKLLGATGIGATVGLVALGFTSVYREGFEVVLFLQNLRLQSGDGVVVEGVLIGLAATAVVGFVTFKLQRKLPYKRMLIVTGMMIGLVLMVMIGGTALSFIELGWIPGHETPFTVPAWMGSWFEMYSYWETLGAQVLAGLFVIGSYYAAQYVKVTRPRKRGEQVASVASAPPVLAGEAA